MVTTFFNRVSGEILVLRTDGQYEVLADEHGYWSHDKIVTPDPADLVKTCQRCHGMGFIGATSDPVGEDTTSCPDCLDKGICPRCGEPTDSPGDPDTGCSACEWGWEHYLLKGGLLEAMLKLGKARAQVHMCLLERLELSHV